MHGRLKVKTTEEQKKAKLEEKERKWSIFRVMRDEVMDARRRGEKSQTVLKTLGECVRAVPEWTTMWAYRREILEGLEEDAAIYKEELALTEACLRENSKAYAVWHHRAWIMDHNPHPDWSHELILCNKALDIDGRNFHCWDYRRFVAERGSISPNEELAFSNSKINNDMSDYSSWHYRRSLLKEDNIDIDFELDLINNAVYTDPSDQSPWFYLRWLITNHSKATFLREMYVSKPLKAIILISSEPVSRSFIEQYVVKVTHVEGVSSTSKSNTIMINNENLMKLKVRLELNEKCEETGMINGDHNNKDIRYNSNNNVDFNEDCSKEELSLTSLSFTPAVGEALSYIWLVSLTDIDLSKNISVEVLSMTDESFLWQCNLSPSSHESLIRVDTDIHRMLCDNVSSSVSKDTLITQLSIVKDLLEMEPTNKWSLLAIVSLLRLLSPLESQKEILDILLNRLPTIDPLRTRFYSDAASKFSLECHLISLYHSHNRHVSMASRELTSLSHLSWMALMTTIDLSHNRLTFIPDLFSNYLLCLAKLDISHNLIVSLLPLKGLHSLQHLDVSHNLIAKFEDLEPILHCIKLVDLNIKDNLVSQLPNLTELVTNHPTSRLHIGSLSIIYDKYISLVSPK